MSLFHVNPTTGQTGKCTAEKNCPFGESMPHSTTEAGAREAYESYVANDSDPDTNTFAKFTRTAPEIEAIIDELSESRKDLSRVDAVRLYLQRTRIDGYVPGKGWTNTARDAKTLDALVTYVEGETGQKFPLVRDTTDGSLSGTPTYSDETVSFLRPPTHQEKVSQVAYKLRYNGLGLTRENVKSHMGPGATGEEIEEVYSTLATRAGWDGAVGRISGAKLSEAGSTLKSKLERLDKKDDSDPRLDPDSPLEDRLPVRLQEWIDRRHAYEEAREVWGKDTRPATSLGRASIETQIAKYRHYEAEDRLEQFELSTNGLSKILRRARREELQEEARRASESYETRKSLEREVKKATAQRKSKTVDAIPLF